MGTLQEEVAKTLEKEREINNAIMLPMGRGKPQITDEVRRIKLDHFMKLMAGGMTAKEAAANVGFNPSHNAHGTLKRWARYFGVKLPDFRSVRYQKEKNLNVKMAPVTKPIKRAKSVKADNGRTVHTYTPEMRAAAAEKAAKLLESGKAINVADAAKQMGGKIHPATLSGWLVKSGRRARVYTKRKHLDPSVTIDVAVEVFSSIWPNKPQSKARFENALLREALRKASS